MHPCLPFHMAPWRGPKEWKPPMTPAAQSTRRTHIKTLTTLSMDAVTQATLHTPEGRGVLFPEELNQIPSVRGPSIGPLMAHFTGSVTPQPNNHQSQ